MLTMRSVVISAGYCSTYVAQTSFIIGGHKFITPEINPLICANFVFCFLTIGEVTHAIIRVVNVCGIVYFPASPSYASRVRLNNGRQTMISAKQGAVA